ncbi:hypothetical protein CDD82_7667 [Ophiocordyceps australis]|uniref:TOM core complex subunit Tom6 n=1 Tax=Ophiocordyceps australis TaxID=1399860 RepID=A0A2C5YRN2_9HYPO|nr:hypothetical protein CDD82_7667 [Ophiocordyceps australis]
MLARMSRTTLCCKILVLVAATRLAQHPNLTSPTFSPALSLRTMPPSRIHEKPAPRRAPKGFWSATYHVLTAPENASMVRSIAAFGAAVAFLASPWGEILLPPA